jgi:hypothetical protein
VKFPLRLSLLTLILWGVATGLMMWLNFHRTLTYVSGWEYGFPFGFLNVFEAQHESSAVFVRDWRSIGVATEQYAVIIDLLCAALNLLALMVVFMAVHVVVRWAQLRRSALEPER